MTITAVTFAILGALMTNPQRPSTDSPAPTPGLEGAKSGGGAARTNRLAAEKSPYLLQHQHNPVDWFPWGEEAFTKARLEDKAVFVSIGYSTCHWCHVMERESFENEEVARFLNENFVSIKVDREERPDVDRIYMTFVQAMTGAGGWPLNVFVTPDRRPFYGGTYWPPQSKHGRPSFLEVLGQIHTSWQSQRERIDASAADIHAQLERFTTLRSDGEATLDMDTLTKAARSLERGYDSRNGGWGDSPKFPMPSHPAFLLSHGVRQKDREVVESVVHTCRRMAAGGIYDQLGGGFSRYSVDEKWLVPHFEKMLYDNAQLIELYLDVFLVTGEVEFADVARGTASYVLRDLRHPQGGFYSAEDADSEGKEGKFYCWTLDEMSRRLPPEQLGVAVRALGVTPRGNFVDHSDPDPLLGQNVLHRTSVRLEPAELELLESAKQTLLRARAERVRPHLDDKVLASWNGLMLGAIARAGTVLNDDAFRQAALQNLTFLQAQLWHPESKTLYHRWRDGERDRVQLAQAYAFLLSGVIELYQTTLDPTHLAFAIELAESLIAGFHDAEHGGFWQSPAGSDDLILRVKDDHDGAEPSVNSVATLALLKLAAITDRKDLRQVAMKTLQLFAQRLRQAPRAMPYMLSALEFALHEPRRVVISGDPSAPEARELVRAAHTVFQPLKVVLGSAGPVDPFAQKLPSMEGRATAYVCSGTACQPPTHDAERVRAALR